MLEIIIPLKIIILSYILYFRTFPWKYLNNHICPEYMTSYIKKSSYNSVPLPHHPCVWWLGQCFIHLMQYSVFAILKPVHHIEKYETCFRLRTVFCPRMLYFRIYIINSELRSYIFSCFVNSWLSSCNSWFISSNSQWTLNCYEASFLRFAFYYSNYFRGCNLRFFSCCIGYLSFSSVCKPLDVRASCATCYIFFAKESFNHTSHGMRLGT